MFNVPILFLTFNRPDTTRRVFEIIRQIQPARLFIAADGPRSNRPDDFINCQEVRDITLQIDWDCKVEVLFSQENLGCKVAVSTAINWFFSHVEEGIILEDDCLPDPSFFSFCQVLLERYRYDDKVMHISGQNLMFGKHRGKHSYYFSKYPLIWGWATWRRAWKRYNISMTGLEDFKTRSREESFFSSHSERTYWLKYFDVMVLGTIDTWDIQWTFSLWQHKGLSISPNVNLVTNIGFGTNATHTTQTDSKLSNIRRGSITDITHPGEVVLDDEADKYMFEKVIYNALGFKQTIWGKLAGVKRRINKYLYQ